MGGEGSKTAAHIDPQRRHRSRRARPALRRGRRWIVIPTLACAIAAIAVVTMISPRYTGVAKILLENQESYFTRPDKATVEPARISIRKACRARPRR